MTRAWGRLVKMGLLCSIAGSLSLLAAPYALAQDPSVAALMAAVESQKQALAQQKALLEEAQGQIARQQAQIDATQVLLKGLKAQNDRQLADVTARGAAAAAQPIITNGTESPPAPAAGPPATQTAAADIPLGPVGQAPPPKDISEAVLPQGVNILTRPGHFVFDTAAAYVQSSNNLLVFRGVEIVPGVEVGLIDANNTSRNQVAAIETVRYGIAPRFEIEVVAPYLYGNDRVTETVQRDSQVTQTTFLHGAGLGDVEFTGRYQITDGRDGQPIVVGNLRVKPPTGTGPFDLKYDQYGAALNLPTGSGFWGVEPSVSALIPTDPAVIFATVGYLYNFERSINKTIGGAFIGKVAPGGSADVSLGFALALNQRFSFSLGFKDSYIFDTTEFLNGAPQKSQSLQVGSMLLGLSYRLTDQLTIAENLEFGITSDAPNLTWTAHIPFAF